MQVKLNFFSKHEAYAPVAARDPYLKSIFSEIMRKLPHEDLQCDFQGSNLRAMINSGS